ncbi:hypothetical protein M4578_17765 [Salipiger sp. P9]|uniref:hypothetical protein n=1 Tax=Salipiger pentaromativorans TaxID=2943193 RepID=UPI0021571AB9|nr:hypothetical protein [Salipiger pentaromativorans]MCR8549680.1 hypothetical protein [Salipiger pentaromativorans]
MTRLYQSLKARLGRRARYRRTLRELRALPLDTALDLDIYRGDARRIASEAVYGLSRG